MGYVDRKRKQSNREELQWGGLMVLGKEYYLGEIGAGAEGEGLHWTKNQLSLVGMGFLFPIALLRPQILRSTDFPDFYLT